MELVERGDFLELLQSKFESIKEGEGHSIFVSGEAGIGKTSLVKAFCREIKDRGNIYQGTCDALFTPRPLAPLYDIMLQLRNDFSENDYDRNSLFTGIFQEIKNQPRLSVVIIED